VARGLIAIDLDGTLLDSRGQLSAGNAEALRDAVAAGFVVAPATARWYQAAVRPFAQLGLEVAAIAAGGADVRLANGEVAAQHMVPAEAAEFLVGLCDRAGWVATLATPERAYRRAAELPPWAANAPEWLKPVTSFDGVPRDCVLSLLAELHDGDPRVAELEAWRGRLSMHNAVSFNGDALLTVTAAEVDKGTALLALCRATGVDPRDAVAIGDSEVDLPMFAVAGTSVAMGNASAAIQARATRITAAADDDGVAAALRAVVGSR
jgi:Cof subfamily protein (haloacid dehalogenase superfamily)